MHCVGLVSVSIFLLSGVHGIGYRSTLSTIVEALGMIALLGKVVAQPLNGAPWLTWVIIAVGAGLAAGGRASRRPAVDRDEVFRGRLDPGIF